MSIEVLPLGQKCNLGCTYCYEQPMRDAGNTTDGPYDFARMIAGLEAEGVGQVDSSKDDGTLTGFTLFGGEPLLLPRPDLIRFCEYATAKHVPLSVQTNGSLLTPWHVDLFARFDVDVGISVDGPGRLNDARFIVDEATTRAATARTIDAIDRLCRIRRPPGMIVTLSTMNAVADRLDELVVWITSLIARGVVSWNFHTLETDNGTDHLQLSTDEAVRAADVLMTLADRHGLNFAPWADMQRALTADDAAGVACIWHSCDPLTTNAVRGIDGQGHRKNCGRVSKHGVPARKADTAGHERQLALYLTPQEFGGCQGCRFFFACAGECPGTAEHGDWRFKTAHCPTLMGTFERIERRLLLSGQTPISQSLDRARLETLLLSAWATGQAPSRHDVLHSITGTTNVPHGDKPHGDKPHGDHTDHPTRPAPTLPRAAELVTT